MGVKHHYLTPILKNGRSVNPLDRVQCRPYVDDLGNLSTLDSERYITLYTDDGLLVAAAFTKNVGRLQTEYR